VSKQQHAIDHEIRTTASMSKERLRIAVIGGGIGGLTLAIALRERGVAAEVYEQAPELTEIGAAVALSANSTRELRPRCDRRRFHGTDRAHLSRLA
jgi:flavin-dependent dehydrogenase